MTCLRSRLLSHECCDIYLAMGSLGKSVVVHFCFCLEAFTTACAAQLDRLPAGLCFINYYTTSSSDQAM